MLFLARLHQMQKSKAKKTENEWIGEHDFTFFMHFQQHYQTQTKHAFTSLKNRVEVAVSLYFTMRKSSALPLNSELLN